MNDEQLDDAVAHEVLGWTMHPLGGYRRSARFSKCLPDAMVLVKKLRQEPEAWECLMESNLGKWRVEFFISGESRESGWHESLERSICLSALMVKNVEVSS